MNDTEQGTADAMAAWALLAASALIGFLIAYDWITT